ncbi:MAG: DUF2007 domain-containing protein [Methylobacteriaceae bacterium]|nr:DUF2007 domain-containing protein [Methylobacteriaceae bacterium]
MEELLRTNDLVLISAVQALLEAAEIPVLVADSYAAAVDGSLGFLPRRLMIPSDDANRARTLLIEAGFGDELRPARDAHG